MNDNENNGEKKIKRQISIMMLMMTTKTTAQFEKTSVEHHPSIILMRLKEIVVNQSFSTSGELKMRKHHDYGSNMSIKSAVLVQGNSTR
mmetsp:Transcript_33395/g.35938  ORF Transcript_33395/g.35938 Transcript_33395/m.35938 type:complete len:89 (-) Transcript_33395:75-341(-)